MTLRKKALRPIALLGALTLALCAARSLPAQGPRPVAFIAENYDVSATLDTIRQSLTATAKVDFKALEVSGNVRVELHPNLEVQSVKSADGKSLNFERDRQNPLFLGVTVPSPVGAGGHLSLTFTYTGLLANEENSPVPGVRAAVINHDFAYLLLPSRWFPLTDYPSNRYTGTFRLNVPAAFAVAGTGKASAPTTTAGKNPIDGDRIVYTFECKNAAPNGTFVAGNLQLNPQQAEGVSVAVYAPRSTSANAGDFAA
ncbi:MAG TPA: hypothetical protein VK685_04280, partial [Candidatus Acidoferrum sp.]|nr:hypothetical protein [Candidatus Acidoferrum sp.]